MTAADPNHVQPPARPRRRFGSVGRLVRLGSGAVLLPVGIVLGISPIPVGFILIPLSLYLLAGESETARRGIRWVRHHIPPLNRSMLAVAHHLPERVMQMIHDTAPHGRHAKGDSQAEPGKVSTTEATSRESA